MPGKCTRRPSPPSHNGAGSVCRRRDVLGLQEVLRSVVLLAIRAQHQIVIGFEPLRRKLDVMALFSRKRTKSISCGRPKSKRRSIRGVPSKMTGALSKVASAC